MSPSAAREPKQHARAAAEQAARASYGRLVALLAAPTRDLQLAEDAVSGAFEQALRSWPFKGVPDNPEGWLLTVARNRQRDVWKSATARTSAPLEAATDSGQDAARPVDEVDPDVIPERRLALLFVCAHPSIVQGIRTPLMLHTVLGFRASQIAAAYATPTAAMAQRLVRAKRRIKDARIPFVVPDRALMTERLPAVLEAVYGCTAIAAQDAARLPVDASMAHEAQYLVVTLAALLDEEPEAWGLAALVTLLLARSSTADPDRFVPLDEQDPAGWDAELLAEGEAYLRRTSRSGGVGRFRLEAAAQAVHAERARTGTTDWTALLTLYDALLAVAPTLGAQVARAAVIGRLDGPNAGLAALPQVAERFQPYWATRAHLLAEAGKPDAAHDAYDRTLQLTVDPTIRAYLQSRASTVPRIAGGRVARS